MNRRVSKREMKLRFEERDPIHRVHVEEVRTKSALVTVEGIPCNMRFPRQARPEILQAKGIFGYLSAYPRAIGDGLLKRGARSESLRRSDYNAVAYRPVFTVFDTYTQAVEDAFLAFEQAHPIGTIVSGKVRISYPGRVVIDLAQGLTARLTKGECLDHAPGERVQWLAMPQSGACMDVVVRGFNRFTRQVLVSLHSFHKDDKYCNYASGYRGSFSARGSLFEKLPWGK